MAKWLPASSAMRLDAIEIMRKFLISIRKKIEVFMVRLGLVTLPFFPRAMLLACARLTGRIAFSVALNQRAITLANMDIAFGQRLTRAEKKKLAMRSFQLMARVFVDYFWFIRRTDERVGQYVAIDESVAAYLPTSSAVVITAHFGNWELLSRKMALVGYNHVAVSAPLSNPVVNEIIHSFRTTRNARIIQMQGAVKGLLRALRSGLYVALLLDQNTKPSEGGIFVDFFGLPIPMSTSAAILSLRTGVPIVPLFCMARPDGTYLVYALPTIKNESEGKDRDETLRFLTARIAAIFQQEIEKHPEQWMWMYKRWKHIMPGRSADDYPYYAKPLPRPVGRQPG